MSPNRRIFLNIIVTYGRSLYALVIGLFCGRWTLMALGEVDYGLMGVVGGLTAFIGFFFSILSGAVERFYALALGQSTVANDSQQGLENCREWFSLALTVHLIISLALFVVGYPAGEWVVRHYLTIPPERILACVWVWRFTCVSCFLGMVTVPFNAMYGAKQYIAELTVYSFVTSTINLFFLHHMITHPGEWLTKYALWTCLLAVVPQVLISTRACFIFPECRFRREYAWNWDKYKEMLSYTGWNTIGSFGYLLKGQGVAILINKYFGPAVNAASSIANTVNGHSQSLASAIQGAFLPVITTAVGANDYDKARMFAFRFCKFGVALSLIFIMPLCFDIKYILTLWLSQPPAFASGFCILTMTIAIIDKISLGHAAIVAANGRIKWYQIILGVFNLSTLPLAWLFCFFGCNAYFVFASLTITWTFVSIGRVAFAKYLVGMSIREWMKSVVFPIFSTVIVSLLLVTGVRFFLPESFLRLVVDTCFFEAIYMPMLWFVILNHEEREYCSSKFRALLIRYR